MLKLFSSSLLATHLHYTITFAQTIRSTACNAKLMLVSAQLALTIPFAADESTFMTGSEPVIDAGLTAGQIELSALEAQQKVK